MHLISRITVTIALGILSTVTRADESPVNYQIPLRRLKSVRALNGHRKLVQGMAFSPDGRYLATGGLDRSLVLWDVASGRIVQSFKGHTGNIQCVAVTPDGKKILTGSAYGDDTLRLWDIKSGKEIRQYKGHAAPGVLYALQILPSGKQFVSCGYDRTIRFWDIKTGRQLRVIKHWAHPSQSTYVLGFSPDGRYAILGGQVQQTKLLDLLLDEVVLTMEMQSVQGAFSPEGEHFQTSVPNGTTYFWKTRTGKNFLTLKERCAIAPDGKMALTESGRFLSLPDGKALFHIPGVRASLFSPDGRYVIGRGDPKKDGHVVHLWKIATYR